MIAEATWALQLAGGLAAGGLASTLAGLAAYARRRYGLVRTPDEVFHARTADGWTLRLLRYFPAPGATPRAEPLILCHGLAANSFSLDLDDRNSLARYLAGRGFDVVLVDLRGNDGSIPPPQRRNPYDDCTFDNHALLDAPAVLRATLEHTGARQAFWVGHSMGGMIGYVLASREPGLAGLVTLASPVEFHADQLLTRMVRLALHYPGDPIPQRRFALALAPLITQDFPPGPDLSALRCHLEVETLRLALANAVTDLPHRILRQFAGWGILERMGDANGAGDYRACFPNVRVPLLCVAGNADRLAPPAAVQPAYDLVGSGDRTWLCLGENGLGPPQCGHGDIVLGRYAPSAVFPRVAHWLEERATRPVRALRARVRSKPRLERPRSVAARADAEPPPWWVHD